ncbi:hypothetical protein CPAR01_04788, partial [Colletotrichum paranaense]
RDIGLQTFDSQEALRLVDHFLPQTLSNDSIHLSVCPSFSTKICLLLRRDQPLSCLQPFIASSKKGARKDRLTLPLVLSCGVTSFQHNGTETLGDAPNFPQATITLRSRHYLLLLLCSSLAVRRTPFAALHQVSKAAAHRTTRRPDHSKPSPASAPHYLTSPARNQLPQSSGHLVACVTDRRSAWPIPAS